MPVISERIRQTLQKKSWLILSLKIILISSVFELTNCTSIAVKQIPVDRIGFADAMIMSEERLLLLNIVRLHFEDKPYFVSVENITTSNSLSLTSSPSASYSADPDKSVTNDYESINPNNLQILARSISGTFSKSLSFGLNPSASYSNTPTVSYAPLQGDKFTRQLLEPVSLDTIYALFRGGWRPARLMRLLVDKAGNTENISYVSRKSVPNNKAFLELVNYIKSLHHQNMIFFRMGQVEYISFSEKPAEEQLAEEAGYHNHTASALPAPASSSDSGDKSSAGSADKNASTPNALPKNIIKVPAQTSLDLVIARKYRRTPQINKLYKMLGIGYPAKIIHFVNESSIARANERDNIVELRTRSFLNMLGYLSNAVETPQDLFAKGLVMSPKLANGKYFELTTLTNGVLRVHISTQRPHENVSVEIYYRNHWFYISDNDLESKKTLALVEQLFNLQAGGLPTNTGPVLTIPVR